MIKLGYDVCGCDESLHLHNKLNQALDKIGRLENDLETERMKVVACGIAANSNTEKSAKKQRIDKDNPYWTPSYASVCRSVDEEIRLRKIEAALKWCIDNIEDHSPALYGYRSILSGEVYELMVGNKAPEETEK